MKKVIVFMAAVLLMLSMVGCGETNSNDSEVEIPQVWCYVRSVSKDGFVAYISGIGYAYVECEGAEDWINPFNTIVVEYDADNVVEESGTVIDIGGKEETYSYRLKDPRNVRQPVPGEPTFG